MVDASALVEWLLPGPRYDEVRDVFEDGSHVLIAPDLIFVESANAFRKVWRAGHVDRDDLNTLMDDLARIEVIPVATESLLPLIVPLLEELTAYDAAYLALALARGAAVATFDRILAGAASVRHLTISLAI